MKLVTVLVAVGLLHSCLATEFRLTNIDSFFTRLHRPGRFRPTEAPSSGDVRPTVATDTSACFDQPDCPSVHDHKFVSFDGTCNNRVDKNKGRANRSYKRMLPPDYADKTGLPRVSKKGGALPSARLISRTMSDSVSQRSTTATHLLPLWGQFIVHDIAATPVINKGADDEPVMCDCDDPSPECINIEIPEGDEQRREEGKKCFQVKRAVAVADTNTEACDASVRQQLNEITGYIDLGTVYGNSEEHLRALLDPESEIGELKVQKLRYHGKMPHLPLQTEVNRTIAAKMSCPITIHKPADVPCFVAGDSRVNENSALTTQHTIWMIKHNQIAKELKTINPDWEGSLIFKTTRSIVTALQQIVTYQHFLPAVLGEKNMKRFQLSLLKQGFWYGYDSTHDATVANAFAASAFRFGHSMITNKLSRPSASWDKEQGYTMDLKNIFFNSEPILNTSAGGMSSVARGFLKDSAMKVDTTMVEDLTNFLFAEPGRYGLDLMAINIQRGRDHGLPAYNEWRNLCGLKKAESFDDLVEIEPRHRTALEKLYGDVNDIDLFIGGVAERPEDDGAVGPTFACIISHQFRDIKKGDRFWHENGGIFQYFTEDQLSALRATGYSRVLCDIAHDMLTLQAHPMKVESRDNPRLPCDQYPKLNLEAWRDGAPVRYHADGRENVEKDSEWTRWFPASTRGDVQLTRAETLSHLMRHRRDEVCNQVLDTEERRVNGRLQVRFQCPPGLIKASDFPPIESEEVFWSEWVDNSTPSSGNANDDELRVAENPICFKPLAIQVQTTEGVPSSETDEVFAEFSPDQGFLCKGIHQNSGRCSDYRVRYLCRKGEDTKTPSSTTSPPTATSTWSTWLSTDTPDLNGDLEYLYRARQRDRTICRRPIGIEVRTVDGKVPLSKTNEKIRRKVPETGFICYNREQRDGKCKDYEVRYECPVTSSSSSRTDSSSSDYFQRRICSRYNCCQ